jgi:hypothetical protein
METSLFFTWLANYLWLLMALGLLLLTFSLWLLDRWLVQRRQRRMVAALNDSTRGQLVLEQGPNRTGFCGHLQPPPDPFAQFTIIHQAGSSWAWLGAPMSIRSLGGGRLTLQGVLVAHPQAELVWMRGEIPGRALGKLPDAVALWRAHHLDFLNSEYVTRGANPSGVIHAFVEFQTRWEPLLLQIKVARERRLLSRLCCAAPAWTRLRLPSWSPPRVYWVALRCKGSAKAW